MAKRLSYFRERLHTSLWPIPVGWCIVAVVLALLMLWLDQHLAVVEALPSLPHLDRRTARDVVAVVAGSIIGVGGVAFSITMVAMTLTSGQYGPRVLRSFLENRVSKHALGLFLATYAYALIVLSGYAAVEAPRLSVIGAVAFAFAALFGFVQFIHRTATDLQADQIVHRIGHQLRSALRELAQTAHPDRTIDTLPWRRRARSRDAYPIAAVQRGYIQTIDYQGLRDWCTERDALLMIHVKPGDFLIEGVALSTLYADDPKRMSDAVEALNGFILTGPMRTPTQDAEYAIIQLHQLVARALSPGINDPGTAVTCIDWFAVAMAEVVDRDLPGCVFLDNRDRGLMLIRGTNFSSLLKAIYTPLRQFSQDNIAVTMRLLESLCSLTELTRRDDRLDALALHGSLIVDAIMRTPLQDYDIKDIRRLQSRLARLTRIGHSVS